MTPRDIMRVWVDMAAKLRRSLRHLEILAYTSPSNTAHVYQEDVTVLVIVRHPQSSVSYYNLYTCHIGHFI